MIQQQPIPAVGYSQARTDLQERSIPDQQAAVEKWAEANGYRVLRRFRGRRHQRDQRKGRDGFERMMKAAENGRDFRAILCYDMSSLLAATARTGDRVLPAPPPPRRRRDSSSPPRAFPRATSVNCSRASSPGEAKQFIVKLSRDCIRGQYSTVTVRHSAAWAATRRTGTTVSCSAAAGRCSGPTASWPTARREGRTATTATCRFIRGGRAAPEEAKSDIVRLVPGDPEHASAS